MPWQCLNFGWMTGDRWPLKIKDNKHRWSKDAWPKPAGPRQKNSKPRRPENERLVSITTPGCQVLICSSFLNLLPVHQEAVYLDDAGVAGASKSWKFAQLVLGLGCRLCRCSATSVLQSCCSLDCIQCRHHVGTSFLQCGCHGPGARIQQPNFLDLLFNACSRMFSRKKELVQVHQKHVGWYHDCGIAFWKETSWP